METERDPMTPLSVIIPAFRPLNFDTLKRSMAANRDVDAEWIVVDDGSGPEYDAIFAALPKGVQLIRQPQNHRQGAARNTGLARAQGSWIKFLDADDALDTGHLAALLAAARAAPTATIAFAPTKHVFAGGRTSVNETWRDLPSEAEAQFRRQLVRPFLHHCGALFPRDLLQRIGGYDPSLVTDEDGDLLLRILSLGYNFAPVERVNYLYVHHDSGPRVSADDDIAKMRARIRVCDKIEETFDGAVPADVAHALAQRMDKIAMTYLTAFPSEARALLARAATLSPGYMPDLRGPLRVLRRLGGPGIMLATQRLHRRLKGRPKGGAQG